MTATEKRTTQATVPVFLFGARGMLGGELARLLEHHPVLELAASVSRAPTETGHRQLAGERTTVAAATAIGQLREALDSAEAAGSPPGSASGPRAVLVLALPHGESARTWKAVRAELGAAAERLAVVDLAADFRLRDPEVYARVYGAAHPAPEELGQFVYGLPELDREGLRAALAAGPARIAAPGCFATALQLAAVPAAAAGLARTERDAPPWVLHGITGSSGAGVEPKATTHHPHRHGNLWAYGLDGHRHEAELAQALAAHVPAIDPTSVPPLAFLPHSGPFARGIHLTAALPVAPGVDAAAARRAYRDFYAGSPFVEVLEEGVPDLRMVVGSNRVALAVNVRGPVLQVLLTLDNLIKGGSGQGLQCLNLALGLDETVGLPRYGLGVS